MASHRRVPLGAISRWTRKPRRLSQLVSAARFVSAAWTWVSDRETRICGNRALVSGRFYDLPVLKGGSKRRAMTRKDVDQRAEGQAPKSEQSQRQGCRPAPGDCAVRLSGEGSSTQASETSVRHSKISVDFQGLLELLGCPIVSKSTASPPGRISGHRWSPSLGSGFVSSSGSPPAAGTRQSPLVGEDDRVIESPTCTAGAPSGRGQMVTGGPRGSRLSANVSTGSTRPNCRPAKGIPREGLELALAVPARRTHDTGPVGRDGHVHVRRSNVNVNVESCPTV